MLEKVKLALRIKTNAFDGEINDLINAALADLAAAGITNQDKKDPLVIRAVVTFCRANFGSPADYDKMKTSYDEQKAMMQMATGYTEWGDKI